MDLAIGAKRTFVMMNLLTRDGRSKIVPECSYPLTGVACVSRIYTDYAVFDIEQECRRPRPLRHDNRGAPRPRPGALRDAT